MKKTFFVLVALALVGCGKEEAPSAPAAGGSSAPAAAKAEAKPEAKPAEAPKPAAAAQKGLEDGRVIVGYLKDPKDENQCAALAAKKDEAATMTPEKVAEVAKALKLEVAPSCPTEGIVGTCSAMGMLVNYTGPKYTKESAKADCDKSHGKWFE